MGTPTDLFLFELMGYLTFPDGIVSDNLIKVHPQPVGDDSISSRNVDVKTCRGELCSSHFAVANVLRTYVCARSVRFGLCFIKEMTISI